MNKFVLGVFIEHEIDAGGNFHQAMNNIFLLEKLKIEDFRYKILTTKKKTEEFLRMNGFDPVYFPLGRWSILWMSLRRSSGRAIYRIIRMFEKANCIERFLKKNNIDLVYFTSQSSLVKFLETTNFIYTLFDLCHRDNPEFPEVSSYGAFFEREKLFNDNLPRAIAIFVDSSIGKENAIFRYRLDSDRVHIYPFRPSFAVKDTYDHEDIGVQKKYNLDIEYIFYPAQFWPHKNHVYILEALHILKKEFALEIGAIFCGSDQGNLSFVKKRARSLELEAQVIFTGHVDSQELRALYSESMACVMPTFFGPTNLPPLEAFSLGVPLIYSDLPGMRDQVRDAALLMDLNDPRSLSNHLVQLRHSQEVRERLITNGKSIALEAVNDDCRIELIEKVIKSYRIKSRAWIG